MQNENFEWDDGKALENAAAHGVAFEAATAAFRDPFAVEFVDDREAYGEERLVRLAMVDGTILVVVHTERGDRTRLISARRATRLEQDEYFTRASE